MMGQLRELKTILCHTHRTLIKVQELSGLGLPLLSGKEASQKGLLEHSLIYKCSTITPIFFHGLWRWSTCLVCVEA